jgi:hypothetical protein
MRYAAIVLATLVAASASASAQQSPDRMRFEVRYSQPLAVMQFVQGLSPRGRPNPFRTVFTASEFNTPKYVALAAALDSMPLGVEYDFPAYPPGQKIGGWVEAMIKRNLIISSSLDEFRNMSVAIIPLSDLNRLVEVIREFTPVYEKLVYEPAKPVFEKQLEDIDSLITARDIPQYFEQARRFYRASWDPTLPFLLVFYPYPTSGGFLATAFGNIGLSAMPTSGTDITSVLTVMLHEAAHILFDEESLEFKTALHNWFGSNPARSSRYAYALLNESWATAVANGYFREKLVGSLNPGNWYNSKYISEMAKAMYPFIKEYLETGKPMDKALVDKQVELYETRFPEWLTEWQNLLVAPVILSENEEDFGVIRRKSRSLYPEIRAQDYSAASFEKLKRDYTKVIVVRGDNKRKLELIKTIFPELESWRPDPAKDFTYATMTGDKRVLIVVNLVSSTLEKQLEAKLELH